MGVNTLPMFFRKGGEQGNATYDFFDIASGSGYIEFYLGAADNSTNYIMSNIQFYSDNNETNWLNGTNNTTSYVKVIDTDFDILMNKPITVKGKAVVTLPIATLAAANTSSAYVLVKIRKWDGTTETEIVTSGNSTVVTDTNNTINYLMTAVSATVPLTNFKVGEYLRLTIEGYAKNSNAGVNASIYVAHDPLNRTTAWDTSGAVPSRLTFFCPVRIDL